jgi:membrane associated rhomboid family serine protease
VRDAARASRTATTVVGGRVRHGRPIVTFTIIGICVVSFILQYVTGGAWTQQLLFLPAVGLVEPWRFLTAAILHSTSMGIPLHILFNMWALYITGQFLEPVLGRARFIALCVVGAIGSSVAVVLLTNPQLVGVGQVAWGPAVVGASGMVFALFGAMIPVLRRMGTKATQIVVLIVINGVIGFTVPNIAWQAHLGGLVVGLALGYAFAKAPRERQQLIGWLAPAVVLVVLVAATLVKYATTPFGLAFWL